MPQWIRRDSPENAVIYWIGSILRAAAIGGNDFTGNRWKTGSTQSYKGLRTGWYKRRMGMMHSAEALVGEYATVSNWFTELLMTCLQWPGFEATHIQHTEISGIDGLVTLQGALKSRLEKLDQLCCRTSEMPTLVTSVKRPRGRLAGGFRIVTVQQILPRSTDFTKADPTLSNIRARSDDRDHLSRISLLTYRTLVAKLKADNDDSKVGADLIVFPEVAVHPDDQDILKRLADKTKAIIFAGLVFLDHEGKLVNIARWFIPDYRITGRRWIIRDQGKQHMTALETELGISGHRPCQHIIEIIGDKEGPFKLSGAICYDATDLKLAVDLKGKTDLFIVCAHNRDVATFDTMASALNYHMYQHVALVNKGEFGGTTIQAPYREHFDRLISHAHGSDQISINVADLDLAAFRRDHRTHKPVKKRPAGMEP
jgi:predicted amidohydrolase